MGETPGIGYAGGWRPKLKLGAAWGILEKGGDSGGVDNGSI